LLSSVSQPDSTSLTTCTPAERQARIIINILRYNVTYQAIAPTSSTPCQSTPEHSMRSLNATISSTQCAARACLPGRAMQCRPATMQS
jgi:predicted alpha/beta-hydrolase family hydrolase